MWKLKKKRRSKGFTAQIAKLRARLNNGVALAEKTSGLEMKVTEAKAHSLSRQTEHDNTEGKKREGLTSADCERKMRGVMSGGAKSSL